MKSTLFFNALTNVIQLPRESRNGQVRLAWPALLQPPVSWWKLQLVIAWMRASRCEPQLKPVTVANQLPQKREPHRRNQCEIRLVKVG